MLLSLRLRFCLLYHSRKSDHGVRACTLCFISSENKDIFPVMSIVSIHTFHSRFCLGKLMSPDTPACRYRQSVAMPVTVTMFVRVPSLCFGGEKESPINATPCYGRCQGLISIQLGPSQIRLLRTLMAVYATEVEKRWSVQQTTFFHLLFI